MAIAYIAMPRFSSETYKMYDLLQWDERRELVVPQSSNEERLGNFPHRNTSLTPSLETFLCPNCSFVGHSILRQRRPNWKLWTDSSASLRFSNSIAATYKSVASITPELADLTFSQLPDHVQQTFLTYNLAIDMIDDASDPEIWALFERLNTYTLTLNRQERLNARYFGYFKQSAYKLAAQAPSI